MLCLDGRNRRPKIEKVLVSELRTGDYVRGYGSRPHKVVTGWDGRRAYYIRAYDHKGPPYTWWYGHDQVSRLLGWRDR